MTTDSNPVLVRHLRQQIAIAPQQRITFADYMDAVLYHPEHGYYSRGAKLGAPGDFATSAHLSADFGEMLAVQIAQMWENLDRPQPFHLLEMGAGQGILAVDVLRYLKRHHPELFAAIAYTIVETSPALRQQQQQIRGANLRWCDWTELADASVVGCCFSNELVDAFPVHRLVWQGGQWREVYVRLDEGVREGDDASATLAHPGFCEELGNLSTPELARYFEFIGIDPATLPDGYRTEVNLRALSWLETVAAKLQRGYLLTVDYGYEARRYYSPMRSAGTLQCYRQHRYHDDPYAFVGEQDITAHVDFTALQRQGDRCGLDTAGFVPQGLFLMALGLGDRMATLGQSDRPATGEDVLAVMQRRDVLHSLVDPRGLGGFGVLVQQKGVAGDRHPLRGLTTPPMF